MAYAFFRFHLSTKQFYLELIKDSPYLLSGEVP